MRKTHIWNHEEEKYLTENYGKIFAIEISRHLNVSERSVIAKAKRLGLKSNLTSLSNPDLIKEKINEGGFVLLEKFKGIHKPHKILCPICNSAFTTPLVHIIHRNQVSCKYMNAGRRKGSKHISQSYFSQVKHGALSRNIDFDLKINDMDQLLEKQNFKCNLTKWEIKAGYIHSDWTASLDRIDSTKGYNKENIQWLHKFVNLAKQSFSQSEFIAMCKSIAENN